MIPVEIIGLFTKPFALMIRLFANITAGHIIVLSLISMIFIFKSIFVAVPSLLMVLFMDFIELLVAFLQAYILPYYQLCLLEWRCLSITMINCSFNIYLL